MAYRRFAQARRAQSEGRPPTRYGRRLFFAWRAPVEARYGRCSAGPPHRATACGAFVFTPDGDARKRQSDAAGHAVVIAREGADPLAAPGSLQPGAAEGNIPK